MGEKRLGFGCMRLPMLGDKVDIEQFKQMVDAYMAAGFDYFDTAHGYIGGQSETAIRDGLVARYPRDAYVLTNKLSGDFYKSEADIEPLFDEQLRQVGVAYFDYYLMHAMTVNAYKHVVDCNAFEVVARLKAEGRIRHIGISFHDKAAVLRQILTERPEIEVVQIQLNYMDFDDPGIESGAVYEVCREFGKPVIVMEPLKGGALANLPPEAAQVLNGLGSGSRASYANRYAASFEGVMMVLSGMGDMAAMMDNIGYMSDFLPLNQAERDALSTVREILKKQDAIACTACQYCVDGCPKRIPISNLFACMNAKKLYQDWNSDFYYGVHTADRGKASDCIACGSCERACPQHLPVMELLKGVSKTFERL